MNTDQIQKLLEFYKISPSPQQDIDVEIKTSGRKFDYILHSGDFDNLTCQQALQEEQQYNSLLNIGFSLRMLEKFKTPILFVPGNHDPISIFQDKYIRVSSFTKNIHKKICKIDQKLCIIGLGGSTPIYQYQSNRCLKQKFDCFPWESQDQFKKEIFRLYQKCQAEDQIIILSHIGPLSSSTSISSQYCSQYTGTCTQNLDNIDQELKKNQPSNPTFKQPGNLYTGSKALDDLLLFKQNIFMNIHGHTHLSSKSKMGKGLNVVGPGSLDNGDFAELEIIQVSQNQKWKIKSIQLMNI